MQNDRETELKKVIDNAVDHSVDKAFRKYSSSPRRRHLPLRPLIFLLLIIAAAVAICIVTINFRSRNKDVAPVENHDTTLENRKIFGFTAADFAEPILGDAKQQKLLIVEEKSASVNTTITDAGFLDWGIFTKTQLLTYHGTGSYTVDLTKIANSDISLDNYVLTVKIPHAALHSVSFDPNQTEIGDTENGWLAFGSVKLTADQTKQVEADATERLRTALNTSDCLNEADRFARLTVTEEFQKLVSAISPVYRVDVEFQDDGISDSTSDTTAEVSENQTFSTAA